MLYLLSPTLARYDAYTVGWSNGDWQLGSDVRFPYFERLSLHIRCCDFGFYFSLLFAMISRCDEVSWTNGGWRFGVVGAFFNEFRPLFIRLI
jgi:hypothetical protein